MSGSDDFFRNFDDSKEGGPPPPPPAAGMMRNRHNPTAAGATSSSTTRTIRPPAGSTKAPPPPPPPRGAEPRRVPSQQPQQPAQPPSQPQQPRPNAAPRPGGRTSTASTSYYQNQASQSSGAARGGPSAASAAAPSYLLSQPRQPPTSSSTTRTPSPGTYYGGPGGPSSAAPSSEATSAAPGDDWYAGSTPTAAATGVPSQYPSYQPQPQSQPIYEYGQQQQQQQQQQYSQQQQHYSQQQQQQQQYSQASSAAPWTPNSNPSEWEGAMSATTNVAPVNPAPAIFQPSLLRPSAAAPAAFDSGSGGAPSDYGDLDHEPPLLEELGINLQHIWLKTKAVVLPFRRFSKTNTALLEPDLIVKDADLAGPLALALALGGELLLMGKVHFGYIYGFGVFGCLSLTLVLNLMSPASAVSVWTVTSILGYSLLPVNVLAALRLILFVAPPILTQLCGVLAVVWSTTASTRLFEVGCGMDHQRYLIAYPIALVYSAFVLITIF